MWLVMEVWCCKKQYCIGTWNVRSMNEGKLEVVKKETARVNIDILGISKLKWTGMTNLDSILKSRDITAEKDLYNQSYGFSSSHVWMWELGHKKGWAPKNQCFQTVVLEKTLEGPLDCKEIKPVHPKGNQPWIFTGKTKTEPEALKLWPPDANSWLSVKDANAREDRRQKGKRVAEDEMVG